MSRTTRTSATTRRPAAAGEIVSLEALEARLGRGLGPRPSDVAVVRETARVLRAMEGRRDPDVPTLVCEAGPHGMRIVSGGEALQVARAMRTRARSRGDHAWAMLLGRRIAFRVVTAPAGSTATKARRRGRIFRRIATVTR
jgi:hypothetical protein